MFIATTAITITIILRLNKAKLKDLELQLAEQLRRGNLASRRAQDLQTLILRNYGTLGRDSDFISEYDQIIKSTDNTNHANV